MWSQTSEYALRAMTALAQEEAQRWVLASELAERLGIPAHYLAKILRTLVLKGILESQRGRTGGFRLAKEPEALSAWDIVVLFEDTRSLQDAVQLVQAGGDYRATPVLDLFRQMATRFRDRLRATTLRDLANGRLEEGVLPANSSDLENSEIKR